MNKIRLYRYFSVLVLLLSLVFIYPTFQSNSLPDWWNYFFPSKKINLGLDLRGGIFVVLGLDKESSGSVIADKESGKIKSNLLSENILFRDILVNQDNQVIITFYDEDSLKTSREILEKSNQYVLNIRESSIEVSLNEEFLIKTQQKLLKQVQNILSNRVDQFGVIESSIQLSGSERIIVQIPGINETDRERILNIISKTAMLEFKPVVE